METNIIYENWEQTVLNPAMYENIEKLFPFMDFHPQKGGKEKVSIYHHNGTRNSNGIGVTISAAYPYHAKDYARGDKRIIKWFMEREGLDYKTAVAKICEICGIPNFKGDAASREKWEAARRQLDARDAAIELFHTALIEHKTPGALAVYEYLTNGRGWRAEHVERCTDIGYIDDTLLNHKDLSEAVRAELAKNKSFGRSHRLIIALRYRNNIFNWQCRHTTGEQTGGKYLTCAGLKLDRFCAYSAEAPGKIYVVESPLDALHAQVIGIPNVVATIGGGVKGVQAQTAIEKDRVSEFTLLFDNDNRGKSFNAASIKTITANDTGRSANIFVGSIPAAIEGSDAEIKDVDDWITKADLKDGTKIVSHQYKERITAARYGVNAVIEHYDWRTKQGEQTDGDSFKAEFRKELADAWNNAAVIDCDRAELVAAIPSNEKYAGIIQNITGTGDAARWIKDFDSDARVQRKTASDARNRQRIETAARQANDALEAGNIEKATAIIRECSGALAKEGSAAEFRKIFAATSVQAEVDEINEYNKPRGIPTAYVFRNTEHAEPLTLQDGITLICGNTGHGKTSFLNNLVMQVATRERAYYKQPADRKSILYFSFEVSRESIKADLYKLFKRYFKNKYLTGDDDTAESFAETFLASNIIKVVDECYNIEKLLQAIEYYFDELRGGVRAVFIDYAQLLFSDAKTYQRTEEIKLIMTQIKDFAIKKKLPFVLAGQFNREVITPASVQTKNIGEGGDLERLANTVVGIFNLAKLAEPTGTGAAAEKKTTKDILNRFALEANIATEKDTERFTGGIKGTPKMYLKLLKRRNGISGLEAVADWEGAEKYISPTNDGSANAKENDSAKDCDLPLIMLDVEKVYEKIEDELKGSPF